VTVTAHAAPVVLTMAGDPIEDGAVLVEGGTVLAVGRRSEFAGERIRDWPGVITPGLVNAHAHLQYGAPFAHLATSGLPFADWILQLAVIRRGLTETDWQVSARGSGHQLLKSGTTAVADLTARLEPIVVATSLGLQGISYAELAGVDASGWPEGSARLEALLGAAGRPRGISPHALYTLGTDVFRDMCDLARARGLRLHPHLAETSDEAEFVLAGTGRFAEINTRLGLGVDGATGRTPVQRCHDLGGLGPDVHVAHGVHVDAADRALLRDSGTVVALCTRSNAVLGAGEAPVAAYLSEGSPVALGTDSLASAPDLDLWAEARATRDLARRQGLDGGEEQLVRAATVGGAAAMGLPLGTLEVGGRADLAAFAVPAGDPYAMLVEHGAGSCVATVLGGRLVHRR
jgi:cytosine/adenosine deaminase-related metal-dependent hydrolase